MGLLNQLIIEKKIRMHFGRLIMSYGSIIDARKKIPILLSLIASMVFLG